MSEEQMEKLRQALIGAKKEEGLEATRRSWTRTSIR